MAFVPRSMNDNDADDQYEQSERAPRQAPPSPSIRPRSGISGSARPRGKGGLKNLRQMLMNAMARRSKSPAGPSQVGPGQIGPNGY